METFDVLEMFARGYPTHESRRYMATEHPDYGRLAARLEVVRLHARTNPSFSETQLALHREHDAVLDGPAAVLDAELYARLASDAGFRARLDAAVVHERDSDLDYFGFKTLERAYLARSRAADGAVAERPQHMLLRVALGVHARRARVVVRVYIPPPEREKSGLV